MRWRLCRVLVDLPGLPFVDAVAESEGDGFPGVFAASSPSAKIVSSRASTPATACDRNEPHLELPLEGADIVPLLFTGWQQVARDVAFKYRQGLLWKKQSYVS